MAKMHSRKRGKSGSKPPVGRQVPDWVDYSEADIKELVGKFAKEGLSSALIGQRLRDQYGVPSVYNVTGKTVTQLMAESGFKLEYPEDLLNLIERAVNMRKHLKANHRDVHNTVKLGHVECKIKRLVRYYCAEGVLPRDWKYDPDKAALLVK